MIAQADPKKALIKAMKFCAYQERCHSEVEARLREWGVFRKDADEIMEKLIGEGFLNEERFARAFAGGRFRVKKWGKVKIAYALRRLRLNDTLIEIGLSEIDEDEYRRALKKILRARPMKTPVEQQSAIRFAIARGYESNLVRQIVLGKD